MKIKYYKALASLLLCLMTLSACSVFPPAVKQEMQEEQDSQLNNFL